MRDLKPDLLTALIKLRHELHQNAELSSQEEKTAQLILRWFSKLNPDHTVENLGGHGLAFVFNGMSSGKTVLVRCELDALPIAEENSFDYRSLTPGVSHKCGHDGHMSIVAALGSMLSERRPLSGRVVLLYQPAEETGKGGPLVVADSKFQSLAPDIVFALHNLPKYPIGEVVMRRGTFHCASAGLVAKLTGMTSHAAHPENGISPALAVSELIKEFDSIPCADELQGIYSLATITHIRIGEVSLGVAPGTAELMAAVRCESNEHLTQVMSLVENLVRLKAKAHRLNCNISWEEKFQANIAHPEACDIIEQVASSLGYSVTELADPLRWCEDFSELTARYPGAMFGLGSGIDQPQLHNPDFDFPDTLIPIGAKIFAGLIDNVLG